jgi:hypothetical protein
MTELSSRGRMLKYQLEDALQAHYQGIQNNTCLEFDSLNFEEDSQYYINRAERRINNSVLAHYLAAGVYLHVKDQKPDPLSRIQTIGAFLAAYFYNEGGAIYLLEEVTAYEISRVSFRERSIILESRPQRPPPTPDFTSSPGPIGEDLPSTPSATNEIAQGLHDPETGEMWRAETNNDDWEAYSPSSLWERIIEKLHQERVAEPPVPTRKRSRSCDNNNEDNLSECPTQRPRTSKTRSPSPRSSLIL